MYTLLSKPWTVAKNTLWPNQGPRIYKESRQSNMGTQKSSQSRTKKDNASGSKKDKGKAKV